MSSLRPVLLRALLALAVFLGARDAVSEVSSEARSPADVYERKHTLRDCVLFVAAEMKTRVEEAPMPDPPVLLLLVDPTPSMRGEIQALSDLLEEVWTEGPTGLRIGVMGVGAEYRAPSGIPGDARSALKALSAMPVAQPKNLLEGVRDAARRIGGLSRGPRTLLLVTKEAGDGEDDVEATRDALLDAGVSFYAVAPEAGFERPWDYDFTPANRPDLGLTQRFNPEPKRREKGSLYFGSEVAIGLLPYTWEFDHAQMDFLWVRPPRYPVPSGFGYWALATLAHATGGRYFVFDFALAAAGRAAAERRRLLYDTSRLRFYAPDLRPRAKVLRDLEKDSRAQVIVRIWEHLADEACPIVQDLPTIERSGGGLSFRTARQVRSQYLPPMWYEDDDDIKAGLEVVAARLAAVEQALSWWSSANARERPATERPDPLQERVEADFQLLGVNLLKVRFHWLEVKAAFEDIKPLDITYRRVRIQPVTVVEGPALPARGVDLGTPERNARFAEVWTAAERVRTKYAGTPWALVLEKGTIRTFRKDVQVVPPEELRPPRPPRENDGDGEGKEGDPPRPPTPPRPPAPPPPGPRPGSGSGGPTTGG
jgi:hypothetical protein